MDDAGQERNRSRRAYRTALWLFRIGFAWATIWAVIVLAASTTGLAFYLAWLVAALLGVLGLVFLNRSGTRLVRRFAVWWDFEDRQAAREFFDDVFWRSRRT